MEKFPKIPKNPGGGSDLVWKIPKLKLNFCFNGKIKVGKLALGYFTNSNLTLGKLTWENLPGVNLLKVFYPGWLYPGNFTREPSTG